MLNTAPCEWTIRSIAEHIKSGPQLSRDDQTWEPTRPFGYYSLRSRLRLAWMVFTGRADALRWPDQMPKAY